MINESYRVIYRVNILSFSLLVNVVSRDPLSTVPAVVSVSNVLQKRAGIRSPNHICEVEYTACKRIDV